MKQTLRIICAEKEQPDPNFETNVRLEGCPPSANEEYDARTWTWKTIANVVQQCWVARMFLFATHYIRNRNFLALVLHSQCMSAL